MSQVSFIDNAKVKLAGFGWPRIIIALFLVVLFILAPFVKVSIAASFSDIFNRFGMNALLVLAMVPMVVLYLFFQKQFIEGVAMTGGK